MVMSAKYPAPPLLNERLARREYRDVYIELNAASAVEIADVRHRHRRRRPQGRRPTKRDDPFDIRDAAGKAFRFDGNWREDKMSEADYMKMYAEADDRYAQAWRCCSRSEEVAALAGQSNRA